MTAHIAALIIPSIHPILAVLRLFCPRRHKHSQGILKLRDCYLTNLPFLTRQSLPDIASFVHKPDRHPGKRPSSFGQSPLSSGPDLLPDHTCPHTDTLPPNPYAFEGQAANFVDAFPVLLWLRHIFPSRQDIEDK